MGNGVMLFEGGSWVDAERLPEVLGWTLKPEGLCRDDVCVMVPDRTAMERDGRVDVMAVAEALDRPCAVDEVSGLVAVGAPREARRRALHELEAPDFVLPDIDGTPHALSDHRSKKKLLVAFSSW